MSVRKDLRLEKNYFGVVTHTYILLELGRLRQEDYCKLEVI